MIDSFLKVLNCWTWRIFQSFIFLVNFLNVNDFNGFISLIFYFIWFSLGSCEVKFRFSVVVGFASGGVV